VEELGIMEWRRKKEVREIKEGSEKRKGREKKGKLCAHGSFQ